MRKRRFFVWILFLLLVVIAGVYYFASVVKPTIPVKSEAVKQGELVVSVTATTTSTVKSEAETTIRTERTGRVTMFSIEEGDTVKKGGLVARIDLSEEEAEIRREIDQARATYDEAERNYRRMKVLFEQGYIPRQQVDTAKKTLDIAKAQEEAALKRAEVHKRYSNIIAPVSGVVSKKMVNLGEVVTAGSPIITIIDPDRLYISATIDEADAGRLQLGLAVNITMEAYPGRFFEGFVSRVSPIVLGTRQESRTFEARIAFKNKADEKLVKPGMSADIEILTASLSNILYIPTQAIMDREGKKMVYMDYSSVARLKEIEVGLSNWNYTEVRKGLTEGEKVVVTPDAPGLREGVKLRVE